MDDHKGTFREVLEDRRSHSASNSATFRKTHIQRAYSTWTDFCEAPQWPTWLRSREHDRPQVHLTAGRIGQMGDGL